MGTQTKIALSRLDVLLITLLLAGGLGIWAAVERTVSHFAEEFDPHEETFQKARRVPALQAELATAQDDLTAVRARMIEQRLERLRDGVTLEALRTAYPDLPAEAIVGVRPETLQAFALARLERDAAGRFVAALEAEAAARARRASEPAAASPDVLLATQKALTEARLDSARYTARVAAFETVYPALRNLPPAGSALLNLPPDALQALAGAANRSRVSEPLAKALADDLGKKTARVAEATAALEEAKRQAGDDLEQARKTWHFGTWWKTLALSLLGLVVLLSAAGYLGGRYLRGLGVRYDGRLVLAVAVSALLVAYGYQSAQVPGALAAGLLALLALAWLAAPVRAGASPPAEER